MNSIKINSALTENGCKKKKNIIGHAEIIFYPPRAVHNSKWNM